MAFVVGVSTLSPWTTSFSYPLHTLALKTKLVFSIPINCILPFYCQRRRLPRTNEIKWNTEEKGAVKFMLMASMWPLGSHIGGASESLTEWESGVIWLLILFLWNNGGVLRALIIPFMYKFSDFMRMSYPNFVLFRKASLCGFLSSRMHPFTYLYPRHGTGNSVQT